MSKKPYGTKAQYCLVASCSCSLLVISGRQKDESYYVCVLGGSGGLSNNDGDC